MTETNKRDLPRVCVFTVQSVLNELNYFGSGKERIRVLNVNSNVSLSPHNTSNSHQKRQATEGTHNGRNEKKSMWNSS